MHRYPELGELFRVHVAARAGAEEHDVLEVFTLFCDLGRQSRVVDDADLGAVEDLRPLVRLELRIAVDPYPGIAGLLQPLEDLGQRFIGVDKNSAHEFSPLID